MFTICVVTSRFFLWAAIFLSICVQSVVFPWSVHRLVSLVGQFLLPLGIRLADIAVEGLLWYLML